MEKNNLTPEEALKFESYVNNLKKYINPKK